MEKSSKNHLTKSRPKVEEVHDSEGNLYCYMFTCPACDIIHSVGTSWKFNGNMHSPTFNPSLLVRYKKPLLQEQYERVMKGEDVSKELKNMVCHSFIKEGKIQFLGDCTHHLKGKTVELLDIKDD